MNTLLILVAILVIDGYFIKEAIADERDFCPTNINRDRYLQVYGNKCYEFVIHRHLTWQKALAECRNTGGNLVTVNSMATEEFLMSALRSYSFAGQGIWIGLNDINSESKFEWTSGDAVRFSYWAPGQPGSSTGRRRFLLDSIPKITDIHAPNLVDEDCVLLKYTDSGHWHDYPCVKLDLLGLVPENYPYVCEYKVQRPATTTLSSTTTSITTTQPPTTTVTETTTPEEDTPPATLKPFTTSTKLTIVG